MAMSSSNWSSLGRSNPNPRNSESNDPMRRSFSGNPLAKPSVNANSRILPSDFPRRNSVGRESTGSFRDLDDKENGKDQVWKPEKVRSPASSSKSAKNFMSPTISASSKFTASPRKKVLVERNEPARTSVPSTYSKTPIRKVTFAEPLDCSDLKPLTAIEQKKLETLLNGNPKEEMQSASLTCEDLSVETDKNNTNSSFETFADEPDCVNLDPTFKLSPTTPPVSSTSTILAPLDADHSMPPYDPKTNYLSPRPQFLHYKPKPLIELSKESELDETQESFLFGSFSDTEVTEDTQSEGSQKESEGVSSDEEEAKVSELSPARTFTPEDSTVEAKVVPKSRFFMRPMAIIALILLLSAAFMSFSVTNPPLISHTVFENIYEVYELSEFSKAKLYGLALNFHTWFTKSLSSISELISDSRGVHNLGHLQYCNLTVLHEYNAVDQGTIYGRGEEDMGDSDTTEVEPPVVKIEETATEGIETEEDIEDYEEEQVQLDMEIISKVENASEVPESEELLEAQPATVIETEYAQQPEVSEPNYSGIDTRLKDEPVLIFEVSEIHDGEFKARNLENASEVPESEELLEPQPARVIETEYAQQPEVSEPNYSGIDTCLKDEPVSIFEVSEIHDEEFKARNLEDNGEKHSNVDSDVTESHTEAYGDNDINLTKADGESFRVDAATRENEKGLKVIGLPPRIALHLLFCGGAILITGAAFYWSGKGKSRSTKFITSSVEQPLFAKAFYGNSLPTPKEQSYIDKPSSLTLRTVPTEMDVNVESYPSEVSSFHKSASYTPRVVKELNEVESLEKKLKQRRESLASSSEYSMGSPSYGSFTTYEKIPIKHGGGDEEIVTPVRRSSRIRSKAASPL